MHRIVVTAACVGVACAVALGAGATTPRITSTSIAGAKIGLSARAYKSLLGRPVATETLVQPENWSRLVFSKRQVSVYFASRRGRAVIVTTWNKSFKTAAGIGPCSTIAQLKKAYGARVKPSPANTVDGHVYAYIVGKNLLFAANGAPPHPSKYVTAVALYDGSDPDVKKPGGSLSFAGFVALSEASCY
jgi:hypothetical protein